MPPVLRIVKKKFFKCKEVVKKIHTPYTYISLYSATFGTFCTLCTHTTLVHTTIKCTCNMLHTVLVYALVRQLSSSLDHYNKHTTGGHDNAHHRQKILLPQSQVLAYVGGWRTYVVAAIGSGRTLSYQVAACGAGAGQLRLASDSDSPFPCLPPLNKPREVM